MKKVWTVLFVLAVAAPAAAQRGTVEPTQDPEAAKVLQEKLMAAIIQQKVVGEVRARTAVEGRITPNAPYSAEAVCGGVPKCCAYELRKSCEVGRL